MNSNGFHPGGSWVAGLAASVTGTSVESTGHVNTLRDSARIVQGAKFKKAEQGKETAVIEKNLIREQERKSFEDRVDHAAVVAAATGAPPDRHSWRFVIVRTHA